jgi:hypothetical protein
MSHPSEALLDLLSQAADLRARGASWEAVANSLGHDVEVCKRWPRDHPDEWRRLLYEAEDRFLHEVGSEAGSVLRRLLRAEDAKVSREVCRFLYGQFRRLRQGRADATGLGPRGETVRLAEYLEGLNDAETDALIDELVAQRQPQGGAPPAAGGGPPGPPVPG